MMPPSRLGCPLSLKTPNMGNTGLQQFFNAIEASTLDMGRRSIGIGGETSIRVVEFELTIQGYSTSITLHIP